MFWQFEHNVTNVKLNKIFAAIIIIVFEKQIVHTHVKMLKGSGLGYVKMFCTKN